MAMKKTGKAPSPTLPEVVASAASSFAEPIFEGLAQERAKRIGDANLPLDLSGLFEDPPNGAIPQRSELHVLQNPQTPVPDDLRDYLLTLISPPDERALYMGELPDTDWAAVKGWKNGSVPGIIIRGQPNEAQSKELLRVLKPGAHLLLIAPDEQPTGHTGACTIEDNGFEIRDAILWVREAGEFHYVAKAARREREAGCQDLPPKTAKETVNSDPEDSDPEDSIHLPETVKIRPPIHNNHPCLHPDALVLTINGYRPIREVQPGQAVYTADGTFHEVEVVSHHPYHHPHLFKIAVQGTNYTSQVSNNHPYLIWRPQRTGKRITGGEVIWSEAEALKAGDYTMTPCYRKQTREDDKPDGFWFLFGLWLAEGVLQKAGHGENAYPSFSLHENEKHLVRKIKKFFTPQSNVGVYLKPGSKGIQVIAFNPVVGAEFKRLGKCGASTKSLSVEVFAYPRIVRQQIFEGWLAGDGGKVRTYLQAKTVSPDLASQMQLLAEEAGYRANLFRGEAAPGKIGSRAFKRTLPVYTLQFYSRNLKQGSRKPSRPAQITHEGVVYSLRHIKEVSRVPYKGEVWNLTVNGSPTFQTAVGMSHNTVKPKDLMEKLLHDVPKDKGPVLDPFMGCYDEATEVLTHDGWKYFADLESTDQFITRSTTGFLVYQEASATQQYSYDGPMIRFKSRSTDLLVTPNHNMWMQSHTDFCASRPARMFKAGNLSRQVYRIPCGGQYTPEKRRLSRTLMYLIGLYVTEGYFDKQRPCDVVICQNKGPKWDRMWDWLKPLHPRTKGARRFVVRLSEEDAALIRDNCGKSKYRKFLSPAILSNEHLDALRDAMMLGDGHVTKDGQRQYFTVSPYLADAFQELTLKLGCDSTRLTRPARTSVKEGRRITGTTPEFVICERRSQSKKILPSEHISTEQYTGRVYCVTVPNHTLFVRRNGFTSWCGNSGTTGLGCIASGHDFIGIDRDEDFVKIATARAEHWTNRENEKPGDRESITVKSDKPLPKKEVILDLFSDGGYFLPEGEE